MKKILKYLFSVENTNTHKVWTILGLKIKFKYSLEQKKHHHMFEKRNLWRNATIELDGLHKLKPKNYPEFFRKILKDFYFLKEKFEYFVLGHVNISQIEFTLTTKCTLKCRYCINYIPRLSNAENKLINFEDFKLYIDNLTKSVNKIYNLILLGGEPLLVKNLDKYLEYAAKNKKIKNVWITTNGTMLMPENLINIIKKYRKKVTIWVSNYSANPDLKNILKHEKLFEQIKETGADLIYNKDLNWGFVTEEIKSYNRERKDNISYFKKCMQNCLAVFDDKLFVCPRAGTFYLKGLYKLSDNELVSLKNNNHKELKKQIIQFYSRDYFSACDCCNIIEDRKKPRMLPAIQII